MDNPIATPRQRPIRGGGIVEEAASSATRVWIYRSMVSPGRRVLHRGRRCITTCRESRGGGRCIAQGRESWGGSATTAMAGRRIAEGGRGPRCACAGIRCGARGGGGWCYCKINSSRNRDSNGHPPPIYLWVKTLLGCGCGEFYPPRVCQWVIFSRIE
jgi:hypothetical protein